jgi:hypothetical protein
MPAAELGSMTELFGHRFLHALREGKHLSARKVADLLSWKHSGFHIDSGGESPSPPHDTDRQTEDLFPVARFGPSVHPAPR